MFKKKFKPVFVPVSCPVPYPPSFGSGERVDRHWRSARLRPTTRRRQLPLVVRDAPARYGAEKTAHRLLPMRYLSEIDKIPIW